MSKQFRAGAPIGALMTLVAPLAMPAEPEAPTVDRAVLEEITVTAFRRDETVQDVPASITAFTGDQLQDLGLANSQDLATQIPGLSISGPFAESSPQIAVRGVGNNGFSANSVSTVGVYVDEVYLNQTIGHGFQMFDLERVELLRGPQGTLYGANTTSGALNFISRKPSDQFELEGELTYGNYDLVKADAAVNIPLSDHLATRLSARFNESDGNRRNVLLNRDANFVDDFAWRAQLGYEASATVDVLMNVHGSRSRNDGAQYEQQGVIDPATFQRCSTGAIAAGACTDFFGYRESPDIYSGSSDVPGFSNVDTLGAALTVNWQLESLKLTAISAYEETDRDTLDELDGSPFDAFGDQFSSDARQFSQELRLSSDASDRFSWILGAYFFREDANEFEPLPARAFGPGGLTGLTPFLEGVYRYFDLDTRNWATFADATYEITDNLAVRGGLRYTSEKKSVDYEAGLFNADGTNSATVFTLQDARARTFFPTIGRSAEDEWNVVTGRLVLEYSPSRDLLLYTSVARGFRGGNFNSGALFSDAEFTLVDPEFVAALEGGVKATLFHGKATFNTSAFYYRYEDQQVTTVMNGQQLLANAAKASIWGGEFELALRPAPQLFSALGVSLLDATYDKFISPTGADLSGNELENSPGVTFNGLIDYEWDVSADFQLDVKTNVFYKGDHFLDFSNSPLSEQKGYWLHDVSIGFGPKDGSYKVTAWVKNLWDEEYFRGWADLTGFGYNLLTTGTSRTYGLSIRMKL